MTKIKKIWVITNDSSIGEKIDSLPVEEIQKCDFEFFCRDYHVENCLKVYSPDLIVTDGLCKTRDEHGQSIHIYYPKIYTLAKELKIPIISSGRFILQIKIRNFLRKISKKFKMK